MTCLKLWGMYQINDENPFFGFSFSSDCAVGNLLFFLFFLAFGVWRGIGVGSCFVGPVFWLFSGWFQFARTPEPLLALICGGPSWRDLPVDCGLTGTSESVVDFSLLMLP